MNCGSKYFAHLVLNKGQGCGLLVAYIFHRRLNINNYIKLWNLINLDTLQVDAF